jgi:hypothetical protein
MEMRNKQIAHARNLWDRAVTILPRVSQFWLKAIHMEGLISSLSSDFILSNFFFFLLSLMVLFLICDVVFVGVWDADMLGNYARVRDLYERWMQWDPDENAWMAYIKWETRNGELGRVRDIYRRFLHFLCLSPFLSLSFSPYFSLSLVTRLEFLFDILVFVMSFVCVCVCVFQQICGFSTNSKSVLEMGKVRRETGKYSGSERSL